MRKLTLPILLLAFAGAAFAADPQTIELKDGGKIVIEEKGTMVHIDAAGNRVKMRDGRVMIAKDGQVDDEKPRDLENHHRARHAQAGPLGDPGTFFRYFFSRVKCTLPASGRIRLKQAGQAVPGVAGLKW